MSFAKRSFFFLPLALVCLRPGAAQSSTEKIVSASDKFLATLSDEQRRQAIYAFDDDKQRSRWSNFPTGVVPRGGISLKEMSSPQTVASNGIAGDSAQPDGC